MKIKFLHIRVQFVKTFSILLTAIFIYKLYGFMRLDISNDLPPHLQKYIIGENISNLDNIDDVEKLKTALEKINLKQNVSNKSSFRPVGDDTPVIVIQVHKSITGLQYLILSLSQVQGIQTALLIFSHSYYHESINRLVRNIDFCKVMQIFYPFSLQLHPYKHPGVDPEDCKPGYPAPKNPKYCLIRDAYLTEHKQHWWWMANFIFRRLKWSKRYQSPVIFLEEDNYVTPDLLYMYHFIHRSLEYFPYVEVASFGRTWTRNTEMDLLTVEPWRPPFDVGLAFNKTTWEKILELSEKFCMYNDYSWSYSLLHLFENFPRGHVDMVACMVPRVLKIKEFENTDDILTTVSKLLGNLELYPKKFQAVHLFRPEGRVERVIKGPPVGSGGWNDIRDQLLCLDPLMSTTTEEKRYDFADGSKS